MHKKSKLNCQKQWFLKKKSALRPKIGEFKILKSWNSELNFELLNLFESVNFASACLLTMLTDIRRSMFTNKNIYHIISIMKLHFHLKPKKNSKTSTTQKQSSSFVFNSDSIEFLLT